MAQGKEKHAAQPKSLLIVSYTSRLSVKFIFVSRVLRCVVNYGIINAE